MDPIHAPSPEISLGSMVLHAAAADPPRSCLLAGKPLVAEYTNATTAIYHIEGPDDLFRGMSVRVSLFVARPPLVSYVLAWSADADFIGDPFIRSTHGGLILLRMAIGPLFSQYYVYQPGRGHGGVGAPSLELVPQPMDRRMLDESCAVGLLSHGGDVGGGYYVAVLPTVGKGEFELRLFCSETGTWTIKKPLLLVEEEEENGAADFSTDKVITIGGGVLAFVDLSRGILIGDVLEDIPEFHYIPLPSIDYSRLSTNYPVRPRDVIIDMSGVDTLRIKFVEVMCPVSMGAWAATTWITTTTATSPWSELEGWDTDTILEARQISVADGVNIAELLPEALEFDGKPNLGFIFVDMPMLSLQDDNIVCLLAKHYHLDWQVWVIAVDMVKKKLLGVHHLVKMGRYPALFYSTVSSHVNMTAAASVAKEDL